MLLREHWDFFQGLITKEQLYQKATWGPNQGISPFYYLFRYPEGQTLLQEHWDFFQGLITQELLHQKVLEGSDRGKTPFYFLCQTPEGQKLLHERWDFFRDRITQEQLHQKVIGSGNDLLKTPFNHLDETAEGKELLDKWTATFKKDEKNLGENKLTFFAANTSAAVDTGSVGNGNEKNVRTWEKGF